VQEKYIFSGGGGDHFVGRTVAGLPFDTQYFAVSPPYFSPSDLRTLTSDDWIRMLPQYLTFPNSYRQAVPFLLSSLVYHEGFLRRELDPNHPIFCTPVFAQGYVDLLRGKVKTGCGSSPEMPCTGVPSIISLSNKLQALEAQLESKVDSLRTELKAIPLELREVLRRDFEVTGLHQLTATDVNSLIDGALNRGMCQMSNQIGAIMQRLNEHPARQVCNDGIVSQSHAVSGSTSSPSFQIWNWGGQFHVVPEGFKLPQCNVKDTWKLWNLGIPSQGISPLSCIKRADVSKDQYSSLSRMRSLMHILEEMARSTLTGQNLNLRSMNSIQLDGLFDKVYPLLLARLFPARQPGRVGDLSIGTLYNRACEYKIFAKKCGGTLFDVSLSSHE
jgi:hypothetical protein